jgi:hypothetical protein
MLMQFSFKPVALMFALVALLAFTPAAMAKHGGGDGGGTGGGGGGGGDAACGSIDTFDMTAGYTDGQPSITWSATTTNLCLDEFTGTTAFDFSNSEGGLTFRSVYGQIGTRTYGDTFIAKPGVTYTIKVSVQSKNKLITSQTKSATAPPALVAAG